MAESGENPKKFNCSDNSNDISEWAKIGRKWLEMTKFAYKILRTGLKYNSKSNSKFTKVGVWGPERSLCRGVTVS